MLLPLLISLALATDTLQKDSMRTDTMREVVVYSPQGLPVNKALDRSLKRWKEGQVNIPSVGEMLEKLSPGINDKITHPFAIKDRKREKRRKQRLRSLEHFDQVKTFKDLLYEAYIQQMREDSIERANKAAKP
jgi:hypothetical protein